LDEKAAMLWALLFGLASVFTVVYNVITVAAILRKRIAPTYFKVKLSFSLDALWCLVVGWFWLQSEMGTYDFVWLLIYLSLMIWYAFILKNRKEQ
jgi:hypothetical protein